MNDQTIKRYAVLTAAAGLSVWAIDMAATQVGLPSIQAALGGSAMASQWILNLTLMILAGIATVGGALGDRIGRMRMFNLGIAGIIAGAAITFSGGLMGSFPIALVATLVTYLVALRLPKPTAAPSIPPAQASPKAATD